MSIHTNTMAKVGRPARSIEWKTISLNDRDYAVGKIQFNDTYIHCVLDASDKPLIESHNWHVVTGAYIGCYKMHDGKKKTLYMHNLLMNRDGFQGKGQVETIDHTNGVGFDNRRANLRMLTQSLQNINTRQRSRTVTLPAEIQDVEIPRNIWYIPPSGSHGARFCIEFKGIPGVGDLVKKTTSSKDISLRDKLEDAKCIRQDILDQYPALLEHSRESELSVVLKHEYETIVALFENRSLPTRVPKVEEKTALVEAEPEPEPEPVRTAKSPKQWKARDIYDALTTGKEESYKAYCEANNDLSSIPTWSTLWETLLDQVKGQAWSTAEPLIRAFVENLRRIRHNALTKKDVLNREDRQVWPAETVAKLFAEGRIHEYKAITETYTGDAPEDPKWQKRWEQFVGNLECATDTDRVGIVAKFMTAQRTKKYRRSK